MAQRRLEAVHAVGGRALDLRGTASFSAGVTLAARLGGGIVALALCDGIATLQHCAEVELDVLGELGAEDGGREDREGEELLVHGDCGGGY